MNELTQKINEEKNKFLTVNRENVNYETSHIERISIDRDSSKDVPVANVR